MKFMQLISRLGIPKSCHWDRIYLHMYMSGRKSEYGKEKSSTSKFKAALD